MPLFRLPQPYDFELSTERFRTFGRDLAWAWHEGALHRVVAGGELRIGAAPGGVDVEPLDEVSGRELDHLLGLSFDLGAFAAFAADDPVLGALERRLRGFRPLLVPDPFEMLVGSITAQQVSLFAATAIRNRFLERFAERHAAAFAFPSPERLAGVREEELVALGFSRRKAEYVVAVARVGDELHALRGLPDDEVKARLGLIRGLGEWSADWFLARHLGRARAWPAGDLGVRKAVSFFYADGHMLSSDEVRAFGARFAPFENLAAHYLLLGLRARPGTIPAV